MTKKLFLGIAATMLSLSLSAVDIYVNPVTGNDANNGSQAAPMKTIESAVFAVKANTPTNIFIADNSIIKLGAVLNFDQNKKVNLIGKNVTIKAHDLPAQKDPSGLPVTGEGNRILRATTGCDFTIKGITFQNGRQVGYILGGAIYFAGNTLTIDSCKFIDNQSGSAGAAVAARAGSVVIKNSYFEGNNILGGGARGAAIMQCGPATGTKGTLTVMNCTFYKNTTQSGGSGVAINIYDSSDGSIGGGYSNMGKVDVTNCTFIENTSTTPYQAAIDVSSGDCDIVLTNNTFYKNSDGALRIGFNDAYLANNVVAAGKQGILSEYTSSEGRTAIVAINNIITGTEGGINQFIDDACFNAAATANHNVVSTTALYPLSNLNLATSLSTDKYVPYLPITSASSTLINAGAESTVSAFGTNYVPDTDIRSYGNNGIKDIGAFEYNGVISGPNSIYSPEYISENYSISQSGNTVTVKSAKDKSFSLNVVDMLGKVVYSTHSNGSVEFSRTDIGQGVFILMLNDGKKLSSKKILL
jgi:hypothetical protein